jgi:arsenite methyltransferase
MKKNEIHKHVSDAYAEALRRSQSGGGSCCSSGAVTPAGVAAKFAGYDEEFVTFREAGQSSFGCGNPLAFAGVGEGETVLDLGSGAGLDLLIAAEKVGPSGKVIGVDMTDEMIEAARTNAEKGGFANVEVRKGIIEELPVEDGSVDWVISNCVVNLSPDKERVFAEIHRVLKPGGRFSISDIVAEGLPDELRKIATVYASCIGGAISEAEYQAGLRGAGLTEVAITDRQDYDLDQTRGLFTSDASCCGVEAGTPEIDVPPEALVASVRFSGCRPQE